MNSTVLFRSFRLRDIALSARTSVAGSTKSLSPGSYLAKLCRPFSAGNGEAVIGIDLGTTNSRVAIMEGKNAKVIENSQGARTTPSMISFDPNGNLLVGISNAAADPRNTVFATKRLMGMTFDDPKTRKEIDMVPYKIVGNMYGEACMLANGTIYSPEEIGGLVLSKMKETAEAYLGKTVSKAVITVPASFNSARESATRCAAEDAGLHVLRIIDEPYATALSYATNINKQAGLIAVFDLGGGTFDVSILEISNGFLTVRATKGDAFLGGLDFDRALVEFLVSEFKRREGVDLSTDIRALHGLTEAAEKAKIRLSSATETDINFTTPDGKLLSMTLTRSKFESLVGSLIEGTKNLCRSCVEEAKISMEDLDEVLLVGGMTRVPIVEEVVSELFRKSPSRAVDGDEAAAKGAAIQGHIHSTTERKDDNTLSRIWYPPIIRAKEKDDYALSIRRPRRVTNGILRPLGRSLLRVGGYQDARPSQGLTFKFNCRCPSIYRFLLDKCGCYCSV